VSVERTLCILKPDALSRNLIGRLIARIESADFTVLAARVERLDAERAGGFYAEHRGKPFFDGLIDFMTSGPTMPMVLQRENAILGLRELMGATNPGQAAPGTLRAEFGRSIDVNTIHGSDSATSAAREIDHFFDRTQIYDR
jgi:nucleoside-diphosphate kinase